MKQTKPSEPGDPVGISDAIKRARVIAAGHDRWDQVTLACSDLRAILSALDKTATSEPVDELLCWSCKHPVGAGYRLDFFLIEPRILAIQGPSMKVPLCNPCFQTVSRVFGQEGMGALRTSGGASPRPTTTAGPGPAQP